MRVVYFILFALAGAALFTFGVLPILDNDSVTNSTKSATMVDNTSIMEANQKLTEATTFTASSTVQGLPVQHDTETLSRIEESASTGVENYVETFLTSSELYALHTQLLDRLLDESFSDTEESIPIDSLGLDRSQKYQFYLEPEDEIFLINNTSVIDLANNPAVGSLLAGPEMKLSVQRGSRVVEIDLRTYY